MLVLPEQTEVVISIPDFYRSTVPAAVAGIPGTLGPFKYFWPSFGVVVGLLVLPATGLVADLAGLSFEITDAHDKQIVTDGRGFAPGSVSPFAQPCLALFGPAFRQMVLDRDYRPHDQWTFSLRNTTAAPIDVASFAVWTRDRAVSGAFRP